VVRKGNTANYVTKPGFTGTAEWKASERIVDSDPLLRRERELRRWQRAYEQLRREALHNFRSASGTRPTVRAWEQATKRAAEKLRDQLAAERRARRETLDMSLYFSDRMLLLRLVLDDEGWRQRIAVDLPRTGDSEHIRDL
jgi:hypothetical protein